LKPKAVPFLNKNSLEKGNPPKLKAEKSVITAEIMGPGQHSCQFKESINTKKT
jgi:hypothetical protein